MSASRPRIPYNRDRQFTRIARPEAQSIRFTYGVDTGTLETITTPQGTRTISWHPVNGLIESVSGPSGTVTRAYDGILVTAEQSSHGQVQWTYNTDLRVASQTVTDARGTSSPVGVYV